jgi:hypothetical protein
MLALFIVPLAALVVMVVLITWDTWIGPVD